ncbi:MAG TPA: hypothetical protein VEB40_11890 [Flavipsychrobacter sp.]|nr:hypothetical protein [Flavipsychrobacter sp.]
MNTSLRHCNAGYYLEFLDNILEVYKNNDWPANRPVFLVDNKGPCYVIGPFIPEGIPIETASDGFRPGENIEKGNAIMVAGPGLDWQAQTVVKVVRASVLSHFRYAVLVCYNDTALAVPGNHIFMVKGKKLITADRLIKTDKLIAANGDEIEIKSIHNGEYWGGFQHISIERNLEQQDLSNRFINTNGVISGDYSVSILHSGKQLEEFMLPEFYERPIVGSYEYLEKYGDECLKRPTVSTGYIKIIDRRPDAGFKDNGFISAFDARINIPPTAHCFLPEKQAFSKRGNKARALSDYRMIFLTEQIVERFRQKYSHINICIDWNDNTANGCSWIDMQQGGERHIALRGGLFRQLFLKEEGLSLVIAHEVGHHTRHKNVFKDGLTCEGTSDYLAVNRIMPEVGLGDPAIILESIDQMAHFLRTPNNPTIPGGVANCGHPTLECRIATFHVALSMGSNIPGCAI